MIEILSILVAFALPIVPPPPDGDNEGPPPPLQPHRDSSDLRLSHAAASVPAAVFADTLDEWGNLTETRQELERRGIRFNAFINDQYQSVLRGGRDTEGSGRNSASTDIFITADLEKLGLVPQGDVLLHLQSNWGAGVNAKTGALFQTNDDADGSIGGHVAQFWYRHQFLAGKIALQLGYLDYQTIVDRNAYANSEDKQFMHQVLDNNPLVPLRIGMGISLTLRPVEWYSLILGVADGQAVPYKGGISKAFHEEDWYTAYLENALHVKLNGPRGPLPGNYRFGVFYDPGPRGVFPRHERDDRGRSGDVGVYVSVDQMLFREAHVAAVVPAGRPVNATVGQRVVPKSAKDEQGLGVFGRFGYRDPETNRLSRFWSGGLSYTGAVPGRDQDVLGFGMALVRSSHLYRDRVNDRFDNETVYELYYAIQVTDSLVITPDLKYIDNPGAAGEFGHALTAALRARFSF